MYGCGCLSPATAVPYNLVRLLHQLSHAARAQQQQSKAGSVATLTHIQPAAAKPTSSTFPRRADSPSCGARAVLGGARRAAGAVSEGREAAGSGAPGGAAEPGGGERAAGPELPLPEPPPPLPTAASAPKRPYPRAGKAPTEKGRDQQS